MSEAQKEYLAKIKKYFDEAGVDVFMLMSGMKLVFEAGSAYEDLKKEKLPKKFPTQNNKFQLEIPKNFRKEYKISHKVDFDRLIRGISILLTGFTGPIQDDTIKNHHRRLFERYLAWSAYDAELDMENALKFFGDFYGVNHDKLKPEDYAYVAQILNEYYKICLNPMV